MRRSPESRKRQIFLHAYRLAREEGFHNLTMSKVATRTKSVGRTSVNTYFTRKTLIDAIVDEGLHSEDRKLIARAIVAGHPKTSTLTKEQRADCLATLV